MITFYIIKPTFNYSNLLSRNSFGGGLGVIAKIPLKRRGIVLSPEILIRYQSLRGDALFPQFDGFVTTDNNGEIQIIGAHHAYSLNYSGHSYIFETSLKVSFVQTEKLSINLIPYYTLFVSGKELSESTGELINGVYEIISPLACFIPIFLEIPAPKLFEFFIILIFGFSLYSFSRVIKSSRILSS